MDPADADPRRALRDLRKMIPPMSAREASTDGVLVLVAPQILFDVCDAHDIDIEAELRPMAVEHGWRDLRVQLPD